MQDGDIVNVDVSPILNGVHSDLNDRAPTLTLTPKAFGWGATRSTST